MKHLHLHSGALAALLALGGLPALQHARAADPTRASAPACGTREPDRASARPDTLVAALYEIVSGPAGARRDWDRLGRLHAPGALITPTQHRPEGFAAAPQPLADFIALNDRLFRDRGFFETEIGHQVETFGNIAHVWSSYETRSLRDGPVLARGVNSFQLLRDGTRWCVLSATWDTEADGRPLPADLDNRAPALAAPQPPY